MAVEFFSGLNISELSKQVNGFILNKYVKHIAFKPIALGGGIICYSVMVVWTPDIREMEATN